uniref:Sushi domain containing 5 n=1 Tax=Seriola lalandi dorsalis TaxID=1841481 RepID=A0A3B4XAN3_SERLL
SCFFGPHPSWRFRLLMFYSLFFLFSGRVFVLDRRNSSDLQGFRDAERACASQHARLASAEELRHAVVECFFSSCTRGWLYGGTVGTTVCNSAGSALKAVDVRAENTTEDTAHLDAFCIKDKGVPCGDPPSFPNARLQGHTGFEMGDDLLYTCMPGYLMPSGHSAFSLLCDSCGEWYGLVQICVKGQKVLKLFILESRAEMVIGRKFEGAIEGGEKDGERAIEDFIGHPRWEQERREVVRIDAAPATEASVSLLSQKHMFWFPSEAFQEEGHPDGNDRYTDHDDHDPDDHDSYDDHDSHEDDGDGHQHVIFSIATEERKNGTQKGAGGKTTTDQTWLDGYPVVPEETEKSDSTTERMGPEDRERGTLARTTDRPNEVEIRRPVPYTSSPEEHESPTTEPEQEGVEEVWPGFISTAAPSPDHLEPSDSPSYSDTLDYNTQQADPTRSWQGDLTKHPFLDYSPAPPVHDGDILTGVMEEHTVHNLPGETGERAEIEGEIGETICTGDDCPPRPPSSSGHGPTVAAIIVAVCVVAAAIIIGVWCYRRQQQKSSVYEMNGKGQSQTRQGQQIEMQQKV